MNVGLQSGEPGKTNKSPSTVYQQMYGGYLNFHPKYLTFEGAYYKQAGKFVDPVMKMAGKVDAWMVLVGDITYAVYHEMVS